MDPLLLGDDLGAVTARPARVALDSRVIRDYASFYRASYASVARALTLTLVDVDLATEATDEAMARAYCAQERLDPDADWRQMEHITLDVAIEPGKEQRWRTFVRHAKAMRAAMLGCYQ